MGCALLACFAALWRRTGTFGCVAALGQQHRTCDGELLLPLVVGRFVLGGGGSWDPTLSIGGGMMVAQSRSARLRGQSSRLQVGEKWMPLKTELDDGGVYAPLLC